MTLSVDTAETTDASTPTEATDVLDTPYEAPATEGAADDGSLTEASFHTVKVRGEELQVSTEELIKGYQRQQDYTRAKQELSVQRQDLGQAEAIIRALDADPHRTIAALASAYEVNLDNRASSEDEFYGEDDMDPSAARIQELEQRLQAQEQSSIMQAIENELKELEGTYGNVDREALLDYAYRSNSPNLKSAYRDMHFDDVFKQASTRTEQKVTDEEITERKRVAGLMEGGTSTAAGSTSSAPKEINSVREAWQAAKEQLTRKG